jgi:hypothetical protein
MIFVLTVERVFDLRSVLEFKLCRVEELRVPKSHRSPGRMEPLLIPDL